MNPRWIQELLGHRDVSTTMIYTHVLNRGGREVNSPAGRLGCKLKRPLESAGIADNFLLSMEKACRICSNRKTNQWK
ncbi:MAG: tyrosine-type recombinase/integrase [Candidatus Methylomirabilis oxygeniifera]|nr:MAG: tyrosine-type recombinase/integrase [Candidatus Methylomirabilis oxyfera]